MGSTTSGTKTSVVKIVKTRHVNFGILPCLKTTSLRPDAYGRSCSFRHVEADEKPSEKSKKGGAEGSVALLKESTQLGCVSQYSYPRTSSYVKQENSDQNTPSTSPRATALIKIRERKGPWRVIIQECNLMSVVLARRNSGKRSHEETLQQERCARTFASFVRVPLRACRRTLPLSYAPWRNEQSDFVSSRLSEQSSNFMFITRCVPRLSCVDAPSIHVCCHSCPMNCCDRDRWFSVSVVFFDPQL